VGNSSANEILVSILASGKVYTAKHITKHPKADIAVIEIEKVDETTIGWPIYSLFDDRAYGQEVMSCGFPEDYSVNQMLATPWVFRGHIQRLMN
jgi:S1-C subfamily serine protease